MADQDESSLTILRRLKSTDLPLWLTPNPTLSHDARKASVQLFSSLNPHCPKSPFDQLLIDGFDAEQIWQQIDLQSQPLLSILKREVKRLEKSPEQVSNFFRVKEGNEGEVKKEVVDGAVHEIEDLDGFDDDMELDMEDEELDEEDDDGEEEQEEGEDEESGGEGERKKFGVEDEFLKIKELEEYMKEDEAREYGLEETGKRKNKEENTKKTDVEDSDDEEQEEEEDEEEAEDKDDEVGYV